MFGQAELGVITDEWLRIFPSHVCLVIDDGMFLFTGSILIKAPFSLY